MTNITFSFCGSTRQLPVLRIDLGDHSTSILEMHKVIIAEVNVKVVFGCGDVTIGLTNNNKEQ